MDDPQPANSTSSYGAYRLAQPTTENPAKNTTEIWEIYNVTGDAHPVHLHLGEFPDLETEDEITFDCEMTANPSTAGAAAQR